MAVEVRPAAHAAPQGAATRYLTQLRPVLNQATNIRGAWVRFLNEISMRPDLGSATAEATQVALGQSRILAETRFQLSRLRPPPDYLEMHQAIDGWLRSLQLSCQIVVKITGALTPDILSNVREALHDAAMDADRFNAERAAIVAVVRETRFPTTRPKVVANPREIRALAIVLVIFLALAGAFAYIAGAFTGKSMLDEWLGNVTPTAVPKPSALPPGVERRLYPLDQIQARLLQEIATRGVEFRQPTVRLVPPDKITVAGRIQGPIGPIPVETDLKITLAAGKIKLGDFAIRAAGLTVPPEAVTALEKRAQEGNIELANQLKPGESVLRMLVEPTQIVLEIQTAGGTAKPGAPAPAKPAG
ncbi:MAG: hypothetical protein EPO26_01370 [Chloroflexota bacterium]|nr:MAG: hypothetical protein EPO26_01370 [Chloroflexota bacterium]